VRKGKGKEEKPTLDSTDAILPNPRPTFKGRITVQPGKPIEVSDREELPPTRTVGTDVQRAELNAIAETLAHYQREARELLSSTYRELADVAPPHLRVPCDCWVVLGDDGIIVRWDIHVGDDKPTIRMAWPQETPTTMEALSPGFSERYVYCVTDLSTFQLPADVQKLQLAIGNAATGESRVVGETGIAAIVNWTEIQKQPRPTANRPIPLVSITNEVDIDLGGEERDIAAEPRAGTGREFVIATRMRLAVGWEAFQIYPPFESSIWRTEVARDWAELDILAAAAQRNLRQQRLDAIDPRAATRREYSDLLNAFRALLDGPEAGLQDFLEANPQLLSPTHLRMWKKVPLGRHVTDLVFREPSDYTLVELEAPSRALFRKDGQQTQELTHAIDQVHDWLRYIEDNLDTVRRELGLEGISSHPACLVVIGRSAGLSEDDKRKLATMLRTLPKFRILTYDDALLAATQSITNLLGPLPITSGGVEVYYR
jgi:hypothetical protein